jgi:hypothetical protein
MRLKDIPTFSELMEKYKTPDNIRQLVKVVVPSDEFGRPVVAPPGVAPDKTKILREAFNKAVSDSALLAEGPSPRPARNWIFWPKMSSPLRRRSWRRSKR